MKRAKYVPGTCNIGKTERLKRALFGLAMVALAILVWFEFVSLDFPRVYRFVLFIPLFLGFLGTFQAKYGFCVRNAFDKTFVMK